MTLIAAMPFFAGASIANIMIDSIRSLYGTAKNINDFLNDHIDEMKKADNPTISRTGNVLEMAKYGFGVGYITPLVVIAAGQMILGNPLAAVGAIVTSPTNPFSLTCVAVEHSIFGLGCLERSRSE